MAANTFTPPDEKRRMKISWIIAAVVVTFAGGINAQVHKCAANGKTTFQQEPCPGTVHVNSPTATGDATLRPGTSLELPWSKLRFGMSRLEVRRALPQSGATAEGIQLEAFRYLDVPFNVSFYFKEDRLTQVNMMHTQMSQPNAETRAAFEKLLSHLVQRHGQPSVNNIDLRPAGLFGGATWNKSGFDVDLSVSPITKDSSWLLLNYWDRR
ncbi:MAG: hypothetical protein RIS44_1743 [Pseudomonadota bacterium]|jgi:hypothetical protein